jgi:IclR family pca regulon transcriptional regulator
VDAPHVTLPVGHAPTEDAVARVLPVLQETARAMRNFI